jgi:hypothetical protein
MSYNLMVFEKKAAPGKRKDFMEWYQKQTEWKEGHGYNDPSVTSTDLRNWFMEMIKKFPQMNGPFALSDDEWDKLENDSYVTDYSVGKDIIYAAFASSIADEAYETAKKLAKEFKVGFFDVNSKEGEIIFPDEEEPSKTHKKKKKWWKF